MKQEKQEIIEKIQKMLLLAKDQDGKPEGEAARSMAARLMAKYRIQETEIDLETDNFIRDSIETYYDGENFPQWIGPVISLFCYVFDTKVIFRDSKWNGTREYEIIGTFSDVETVLYFSEVCIHHIEKAGMKAWPKDANWKKRNQLGNEAYHVLWDRAYELKRQMDSTINEDEGCTALVVKKTDEISAAMKEMYPNLTSVRGSRMDRATDAKTREAGQEAGRSCPLNFAVEA